MKLNNLGGSRTDTLVKFVLVFFVSLLAFSVGTFVGKQFSDSQHRLAALESDYEETAQKREAASIPEGQVNVQPDKVLTETDIAKLAEDFVASDDGAEKHGDKVEGHEAVAEHGDKAEGHEAVAEHGEKAEGHEAVAEHGAKAEGHEAVAEHGAKAEGHAVAKHETAHHEEVNEEKSEKNPPVSIVKADAIKVKKEIKEQIAKVAKKVSEGEEPSEPQAKEAGSRLPSTVAPSSVGKFTIQISAHPEEKDAISQSTDLKEKGYSAFYIAGKVNGKTWYRVNVGLFNRKSEAADYASKLTGKPEFKGSYVKRIVE